MGFPSDKIFPVPRCFRWKRCEVENADIPEGCQRVAGSSEAIPPVKHRKDLHPGGVPESAPSTQNLASRRDAGATAYPPGVSPRRALLNPRLPSGIPAG